MPVYRYKAMTEHGVIVMNTIEESNKYLAIKKLQRNNLIPITVDKTLQRTKAKRQVRRNTQNIEEILKNVDTTDLLANRQKRNTTYFERIYHSISKTERITSRDIIIFTQNFYLLKSLIYTLIISFYLLRLKLFYVFLYT